MRAEDAERGRDEPDPETEKRLLRERTPFGARGDTGRERMLGGCGVAEISSLDPTRCSLIVSSGEVKVGLTGEDKIPCFLMESTTSKSPLGSTAPDESDGIPRPARTDLQSRIVRNEARIKKKQGICAPLTKDGVLNRVDPVLRLIRV